MQRRECNSVAQRISRVAFTSKQCFLTKSCCHSSAQGQQPTGNMVSTERARGTPPTDQDGGSCRTHTSLAQRRKDKPASQKARTQLGCFHGFVEQGFVVILVIIIVQRDSSPWVSHRAPDSHTLHLLALRNCGFFPLDKHVSNLTQSQQRRSDGSCGSMDLTLSTEMTCWAVRLQGTLVATIKPGRVLSAEQWKRNAFHNTQ